MIAVRTLQRHLSTKAFRLGLGVVGLVYVLLFGFLWLHRADTTQQQSHKIASQTIAIEREEAAAEPAKTATQFGPANQETPAPTTETPIASASGSVALPAVPVDGLYEEGMNGRLPIIRASDKLTPFKAYRRPFTPAKPGMPTVSIAVVDYGLSETESKATLSDLSPEVSVILSPYSTNADYWTNEARAHGHEVWLALPVETESYPRDDAGPQALVIGAIEKLNMNKLNWVLSRTQGYAGVATLYQPTFMKSPADAKPVMDALYARGLGFVDGDTTPSDTPHSAADQNNAPYGNANVWIDMPATPEHIAASLRQLEVIAQDKGLSIGFISATPAGLKTLQTWVDGLAQKGIAIAPLSARLEKAE